MKIAIIGIGYVGLVTAVCLAELGHSVQCMDMDADKINLLSQGKAPIYEPGLEEMIARHAGESLHFTEDIKNAVDFANVLMIAVGTPSDKGDKADIKGVVKVCSDIARLMETDKVIIIKSTVPIGTCSMLKDRMDRILMNRMKKKGADIPVAQLAATIVSNPEFLRQGSAIEDFLKPDRIVVGIGDDVEIKLKDHISEEMENTSISMDASQIMKELYASYLEQNKPYVETNLETAEMIKYASNAFLATKISYVNELAIISEKYGADMRIVSMAMGLDERIGSQFLKPGPGYGGSCFPKDTRALLQIGKMVGYEPGVVKAAIEANENQIKFLYKKIRKILGNPDGKTLTVLGLSFKPGTDDLRESPAVAIVQQLLKEKAVVRVYDPHAMENFKKLFDGIEVNDTIRYCDDAMDACRDSECIIIMTDWQEFAELDIDEVAQTAKGHLLIDARNILDPDNVRNAGFIYEGIGSL